MKKGYIVCLSDETPKEAFKKHDTGPYKTVAAAQKYISRNKRIMNRNGVTAKVLDVKSFAVMA